MDKILTKTAQIFLCEAHHLTQQVAATVEIDIVGGLTGEQGQITIGYDIGGRRKVTAQVLLPTVDEAVDMLADHDRIGGLICSGVAAMPAAFRPVLPEWIAGSVEAARHAAMRARVKTVARAAASTTDADLPWAA